MKKMMIAAVMAVAAQVGAMVVAVVDCCPTNDLSAARMQYVGALDEAGHVPFLLPRMAKPESIAAVLARCDLVFFAGGEDVDPSRYKERRAPKLGAVNPVRDAFECSVFEVAFRMRKPMFGICRGLQLLNVCFGGSLIQDIPSESPGEVAHRAGRGRSPAVHAVKIDPESRMAKVLGKTEVVAVSSHHQAVKRLAPGMRIVATAPDGIVEAVEGIDYPVFATQFHPERRGDGCSREAFKLLFRRLDELTRAKTGPSAKTGVPIVAVADYCSYLTNVCAKANLVEAQEACGFASIVVPEFADRKVDELLARSDAAMIGGGIGKRQDYERRCAFEERVLALAIKRRLPIVGICHGSQVINRYLGGTLEFTPKDSPITHRRPDGFATGDNFHKSVNEPDSLMAKHLGVGECTVNSSHTRRSLAPAPGIRVTSRAPDGVIEAFEHETLPIRAFQFHPERLWKNDGRFRDLLRAALLP